MAFLKFILCLIFLFLATKGSSLDPNSLFLGLAFMCSAWILGSEIEKIGMDLGVIKRFFTQNLGENRSKSGEIEEEKV